MNVNIPAQVWHDVTITTIGGQPINLGMVPVTFGEHPSEKLPATDESGKSPYPMRNRAERRAAKAQKRRKK